MPLDEPLPSIEVVQEWDQTLVRASYAHWPGEEGGWAAFLAEVGCMPRNNPIRTLEELKRRIDAYNAAFGDARHGAPNIMPGQEELENAAKGDNTAAATAARGLSNAIAAFGGFQAVAEDLGYEYVGQKMLTREKARAYVHAFAELEPGDVSDDQARDLAGARRWGRGGGRVRHPPFL